VLIKAPAKINLSLKVLSKRADGYHEISSLMRAIRLFDEMEIATGQDRSGSYSVRLKIEQNMDSPLFLSDGPENLIHRAADLVQKEWSIRPCADIFLRKKIPVAAGLGGGSADAAAILLWLASKYRPEAGIRDIASLGARLGADVPFCVYSVAAANPQLGYKGAAAMVADGIGEVLSPAALECRAWVVLVKPRIEIRTSQVYALFDSLQKTNAMSDNDLEAPCADAWPIVAGVLSSLKEICLSEGAEETKVMLSGSGPAVFAYFQEGPEPETTAFRVYERSKEFFKEMFVSIIETL